ncbi:MAG: hypothetical protein R6U41_12505 [Desulfosalsimonas sp.]|uniref:hypothetical protein n=1 Tax=Desulfosalsimonas sp. TaxID=3073848 RepID=UPI0039709315
MNKITTAFFPFTFISERWAAKTCACFGPPVVYQPADSVAPPFMEDLDRQGRIILRRPVHGDDQNLMDLARQYQNWGQMHQKHAAAMKSFAEAGFYNQEFAQEISTEILKGGKDEPAAPDPVFIARLFLLMAQEFDRQAAELENDLAATDHTAQQMFARIRGQGSDSGPAAGFSGDRDASGGSAAPEDPGGYMPDARIRAWLRLAERDPDCPKIWITSSPAVVAAVDEHFETLAIPDRLPENVQAGLPDQAAGDFHPEMSFYQMRDSGRIIGLLGSAEA